MGIKGFGLQFGMVLHPNEPGMIRIFDGFRQESIGRHAGKTHARLFQLRAVAGVHLIAVAVAF